MSREVSAAALLPLLFLSACAPVAPQIEPAVLFLQAQDVSLTTAEPHLALPARVLRRSPDGALRALLVETADRASTTLQLPPDRAVEIVVAHGALSVDSEPLDRFDFLRAEGVAAMTLELQAGARLLVFFDDIRPRDEARVAIVRDDDTHWVPGLAMREAGRDDVPLEILHYRNDARNGARSYLVRVQPGLTIPWERHTVAEEAYLLEGDFSIAECLDGQIERFDYREGGYFYRPPGIAHNGPDSGSRGGAIMLIRTPGALTVDLVAGCPS